MEKKTDYPYQPLFDHMDQEHGLTLLEWKPSKEDIEAINRGEPVYIQIHSVGLPPLSVFTLDENGKSNNAD